MAKAKGVDPNTVLTVGAVGLLGYAGWRVYRAFNPPADQGQGGGGNTDPRLPPDVVVPGIDEPPTLTREAARILADRVYVGIYGDGSFWNGAIVEDEEEIIAAMIVPRNEADVLLVIDEYGIRGGPFWSVGTYTLPAALVAYLSAADRARINLVYARAGINLRV